MITTGPPGGTCVGSTTSAESFGVLKQPSVTRLPSGSRNEIDVVSKSLLFTTTIPLREPAAPSAEESTGSVPGATSETEASATGAPESLPQALRPQQAMSAMP